MQISDEFKKYSNSPEQFQIFTNEISVVKYKYLEIRKQEEAMTSKHLIIYSEQNLISHHNKKYLPFTKSDKRAHSTFEFRRREVLDQCQHISRPIVKIFKRTCKEP